MNNKKSLLGSFSLAKFGIVPLIYHDGVNDNDDKYEGVNGHDWKVRKGRGCHLALLNAKRQN